MFSFIEDPKGRLPQEKPLSNMSLNGALSQSRSQGKFSPIEHLKEEVVFHNRDLFSLLTTSEVCCYRGPQRWPSLI